MVIGERLIVLQRLIALKLGYKREYDFDISPRMLEGLSSGPAKDTSVPAGPYMDQWYTEYYELLEWDPKNGVPTSHALDRLGMMDFEVGVKPE